MPLITTLAGAVDTAREQSREIVPPEVGGADRIRVAGQACGGESSAPGSPLSRPATRIGIEAAS